MQIFVLFLQKNCKLTIMTIAIGILMLVGFLLIMTEHKTNINKASTAMFVGVVGWILFMCTGSEYISKIHPEEYQQFLAGRPTSWTLEQTFIANNVFGRHATFICYTVLYLLSTMAIVDLLTNNGCFDFISKKLRTTNSRKFIWMMSLLTFFLSATVDNLTVSLLMMGIVHRMVTNSKQRLLLSVAVVIAASCGGCFTVIGDVTSLMIWCKGHVTATVFSSRLFVPAFVAMLVSVYLISRKLNGRLEIFRPTIMYRGDDERLRLWQRALLLFVGIGGLWFIPTFHRITLLPPFLGSLCVLGFLWVCNEIINRKYIRTEQPTLFNAANYKMLYANLQVVMFFIGVTLSLGVLVECGGILQLTRWCTTYVQDDYVLSAVVAGFSALLDNIALVMTGISMFDHGTDSAVYEQLTALNGNYWSLLALSSCVGGCLLPIGCTSGYAFLREEGSSLYWYFRQITSKVLFGWMAAMVVYFVIDRFC